MGTSSPLETDTPPGQRPANRRLAFRTVFSTRATRKSGDAELVDALPHQDRISIRITHEGDDRQERRLPMVSIHATLAGNDLFYSVAELVNRISIRATHEGGGR